MKFMLNSENNRVVNIRGKHYIYLLHLIKSYWIIVSYNVGQYITMYHCLWDLRYGTPKLYFFNTVPFGLERYTVQRMLINSYRSSI